MLVLHFKSYSGLDSVTFNIFIHCKFVLQGFFTKAAGRTSSSLSSLPLSPPSWATAGAGASPAPAVMDSPKVTNCWRLLLWRGVSMGASTWEISTISDASTPPAMSQVSWSSGKTKAFQQHVLFSLDFKGAPVVLR